MSTRAPVTDLVVLTADKNCQFALRGLLSRSESLGIRPVSPDYRIHPQKDPGVLRNADDFLRSLTKTHAHALVLMDREGSGRDALPRTEMEERIEAALRKAGWDDRCAAIVIDPELEIWVWADSPHVAVALGWKEKPTDLRTWLKTKGFLGERMSKPERPKEAMEAVLRQVRKPRSSAIYQALAEKVSLTKCSDPAFTKLKDVLHAWFAAA